MKSASKGKITEKVPTKESVLGSSSKDEHIQKSLSQPEEAAPGTPKDKKPEKATKEESAQGSTKDKQPQEPPSQQPSKEEAVESSSKSTKPENAATKESAPGSSSTDAQSTTPPSEPPSKEDAALSASNGKKPYKSAPGAPKRKQSIHGPENCMEYLSPFVLQMLESNDFLEDPDPPGKRPAPKTVSPYRRPSVSILRIPIAQDDPLTSVKVFLRDDMVTRHRQTFFFKNLVCLDRFWGFTNEMAFGARRIVRLILTDGRPTPYFLMVCIGEYPRIWSPRNENWIFERLHVPIYNDAFVFKLGEPELDAGGYANYVDFDESVDGLDWLGHAIRSAAEKVQFAMARHANPGFPDMSNYADEVTMAKDVGGMLSVMAEIKTANEKYATRAAAAAAAGATAADPVDKAGGLSDVESMRDAVNDMLKRAEHMRDQSFSSFEVAVESALLGMNDAFRQKTRDFLEAIEEALTVIKLDETPSASTDVDPSSAKTKELCKKAKECFIHVERAFESMKAVVMGETESRIWDVLEIRDPSTRFDMNLLRSTVDFLLVRLVEHNQFPEVIATRKQSGFIATRVDLYGVKAQAAAQAIDENKPYDEIIQKVIEMNEVCHSIREEAESEGSSVQGFYGG